MKISLDGERHRNQDSLFSKSWSIYIYIYIYMRNLESHMKLEINYDALQYIFLYCPSIGV